MILIDLRKIHTSRGRMLRITEADENEQMGNGPWNMLHMFLKLGCVKATPTPLPGTGPMTTFMLGTQQECVCDHGEPRNCVFKEVIGLLSRFVISVFCTICSNVFSCVFVVPNKFSFMVISVCLQCCRRVTSCVPVQPTCNDRVFGRPDISCGPCFSEDPNYTTSHPNDHYRHTSKVHHRVGIRDLLYLIHRGSPAKWILQKAQLMLPVASCLSWNYSNQLKSRIM